MTFKRRPLKSKSGAFVTIFGVSLGLALAAGVSLFVTPTFFCRLLGNSGREKGSGVFSLPRKDIELSRCPRYQKGTMIVVGELPPLSSSLLWDSS